MFLRWAGSKRQLRYEMEECWLLANPSPRSVYFEAFMGSASLFFHLVPRRAILSDLNAKLVECFEQVKSAPDAVALEMLTLKNTPDNYYRVRAQDETLLAPETRAARFIYLNR